MPSQLWPDDPRGKRPPHPRVKKPRTRSQYRRRAWEDHAEAVLFALDLFDEAAKPLAAEATETTASVPLWMVTDWTADLTEVVRAARAKRVEAYRARHADKTRIFHPADHQLPCDVAKAITSLAKMYREEMLAADGVRFAAKGVHRVRKRDGLPPSYRAQPWSQTLQRHVHVGYYPTEAAAWDAIRAWYEENENVDGIVEIPKGSAIEALMGMIKEALHSQAVTSSEAHRRQWGNDLPGDAQDDA